MTAVSPGAVAAGTMTAVVQDEYGTAPEAVLRLAEITRPAIADDEILVRVRAASVDRGTWHLMAGLPCPMRLAGFGLRRPKAPNPGRSLAGTVESAGPKVTEFKPGDEVYGTGDGSFAPYARAQAGRLAPKPANLSFAQAAAVPVSPPCRPCGTRHGCSPGRRWSATSPATHRPWPCSRRHAAAPAVLVPGPARAVIADLAVQEPGVGPQSQLPAACAVPNRVGGQLMHGEHDVVDP